MTKINPFQWRSKSVTESGNRGVQVIRERGYVEIQIHIGPTYISHELTTEESDDLAKFLIDHGIAERAAEGKNDALSDS